MKQSKVKSRVNKRDGRSRSYLAARFQVVVSKKWRIVFVAAVVVILLVAFFKLVVSPRIVAWAEAKFPEVHAVQSALGAAYPDKKIGVSDQTFYSNGTGSSNRQHILGVSVVGKSFITNGEAKEVGDVVCAALRDDPKKFDSIVLQSSVEKRFLIFYSRQNRAYEISCDFPESPYNDDTVKVGPAEPNATITSNSGTYQLMPANREGYPAEYKKAFMKSCTTDPSNSIDACSCSLEDLMTNYSYQQAIDMKPGEIPEDLIFAWQQSCYLSGTGFEVNTGKPQ